MCPSRPRSVRAEGPNGLAFADIKNSDTWQVVAPSQTDDGIKSIVANPAMINAYRQGVPENGKPFPDGSIIVKTEWMKKRTRRRPTTCWCPTR